MELTKNNSCHSQLSYNLERNVKCKVTYLNWKGNRKEHTEKGLYNLSSDNVYFFFASFLLFHQTFGLN